jgi:pyrroline-5-carboxylate reductase
MSRRHPLTSKMTLAEWKDFVIASAHMKIGVIGCGKMGSALVEGAVKAGAIDPARLYAYDTTPAALEALAQSTGATASESLSHLMADVYLLCTKPQHALQALQQLPREGSYLVISIAAGLTASQLASALPASARVIRSMPNTPAMIGKGAAAFCLGPNATREDAALAKNLLSAVGLAVELPEYQMDAVTGLSGSGPAFVYLLIEAMADGGVRVGLPRAEALQLAAQTVLGAASMVLETGIHPGALKDMVTSPGGTTIAGIAELEKNGARSALIEAVTAATLRSRELGKS